MRDLTGLTHAVVVTEPVYSRLSRQQTVVPVFPESAFEAGELDIIAPASRWTRYVTERREPVILATSMIFTVFQREWITGYANGIVDPITMHRLDEALNLHFGL